MSNTYQPTVQHPCPRCLARIDASLPLPVGCPDCPPAWVVEASDDEGEYEPGERDLDEGFDPYMGQYTDDC